MKEFFKKLDRETLFGGIFGVVAVIAIIVEMVLAGISAESVTAAIKDIAGTIVSVMVFIIAIKHILKQFKESKSFEENLKNTLDKWRDDHANMIVRKEKYDIEHKDQPASCYSFGLKTNISDFYDNKSTNSTGCFVRMPLLKKENYVNGNVLLKFYLNKGTFFEGVEMTDNELKTAFGKLNKLFCGFINTNPAFSEFATAKEKTPQEINVTIKKPIETVEDIEKLVALIDSMYNAYLVAANLKLKN